MKIKVFFIMPFSDEFFEMYEMLKLKLGEKYFFSNAAEEDNQQNILKDIIVPIYDADVVIADLTGKNSNVMYELGVAHSLEKKTIIITKDDLTELPFDLKSYRAKRYDLSYKLFDELIDYIDKNISGAINNAVLFGNPVIDVLKEKKLVPIVAKEQTTELSEEEGEKGFLDYLADIEGHTNGLKNTIDTLVDDMKKMNSGISECSNEINRVNSNGGSGNASFVRKTTRKAANYIDEFSRKLRIHNSEMEEAWDDIEKNIVGLIESNFSANENNKEGLHCFLQSLMKTKEDAINSKKPIIEMKNKADSLVGIQRSMTQAVTYLKQDLDSYIQFIERMGQSIDKIMNKARFVVGEIKQ